MLRLRRVTCFTDLVHGVLRTVAPGEDDAIAILTVFGGGAFCAATEQGCQCDASEDALPVPIHVVFQTGIACGVGADEVVERQG